MVLLVDDQAMIGEAVRRGLSNEENIDFHFCSDPHQAIAQAVRIKPTVILQDLVMPGLDGLSLVREYRNHPATKDIPIIVLSTKEDPLIKSAAFSAGANDYLVKLPEPSTGGAHRYHSRSYMTLLQRDAAYRALRVQSAAAARPNRAATPDNSDGLTGFEPPPLRRIPGAGMAPLVARQSQLSLLMIDVDYFSPITTRLACRSDEALRKVATAIRDASARPSTCGALRWRGICVVLPNTCRAATVWRKTAPDRGFTEDSTHCASEGTSRYQHWSGNHGSAGAAMPLLISAADRGCICQEQRRNQVGIE